MEVMIAEVLNGYGDVDDRPCKERNVKKKHHDKAQ